MGQLAAEAGALGFGVAAASIGHADTPSVHLTEALAGLHMIKAALVARRPPWSPMLDLGDTARSLSDS